MALYFTNNGLGGTQQSLGSSYVTLINVYAGATPRRGSVFEFGIGTDGTPANNALDWDLSRMTAAGTGTSVTPNKVDPADSACAASSQANLTVEPTITANSSLWWEGLNQQATHRWQAYNDSARFVYPATSNNGFVLRAKSGGYTGTATGYIGFAE